MILLVGIGWGVMSGVNSCNQQKAAEAEEQRVASLATRSSAEAYCEKYVREDEQIRSEFSIDQVTSQQMSKYGYRVLVKYSYRDGYRNKIVSRDNTCNLEWRGKDWRNGIRF
ncbi:hypothetical protein [Paenarthrobacter sp. NPDC058040]|uniref:hypothetical protein n=1 Tax=unclassified Paenarthrobacter TaxID=2634190 RepID=UPI0036DF43B3